MALFESTLALLLGAVILTGLARRVGVVGSTGPSSTPPSAGFFQPLMTDGEARGPRT